MKTVLTIFVSILTLFAADGTSASSVFKCIDEDGLTTFAFAPCPRKIAETRPSQETGPTIEEQMAELEILDGRISRVNRQFRNLRLEQENNLQKSEDDPEARREIRASYQQHTSELLDQLSQLRSERGRLVQGSIALLSQSDDV
jgi:hypothetical protein